MLNLKLKLPHARGVLASPKSRRMVYGHVEQPELSESQLAELEKLARARERTVPTSSRRPWAATSRTSGGKA
jgi:hypothetical protein